MTQYLRFCPTHPEKLNSITCSTKKKSHKLFTLWISTISSTITKQVVHFLVFKPAINNSFTHTIMICTEGINSKWGILTNNPKAFAIYHGDSGGLKSCCYYTRATFLRDRHHCTLQFCLCSTAVKYCSSSRYP